MAKKSKKLRHAPGRTKKTKKATGTRGSSYHQSIFQQALTFHQTGRLLQAEALYRQILSADPNHPEALHFLGLLAHQVGKSEIAIELISKALVLKPDDVDAHFNLGNVLKDQGKLNEANVCYSQAYTLKPDYADAYYNQGIIFTAQGKLDDAVSSYRRTLILKPDYTNAHLNLGNVFFDQGKLDDAVSSYRRTLILKPDYAMAHYNLGRVLKEQYKLEEAVASYHRALTLKPDYVDVHLNLGNALKDQGKLDDAVASYRQALTLKPDYAEVLSNLLLCLNYRSDANQKKIYHESLQWDEMHVNDIQTDVLAYANSPIKDRRLRIGYVSPDFRIHSVAFFIEPVIRAHNRERVEIFCYANVNKPDTVTKCLQSEADHWSSIAGMKDEAAAARIKKDNIDILVDLAGHTRNNSLPVFALKPAPVQVTWLGYPNTTGLRTIDYRLTDAVADPAGKADKFYSEKLIRLEHGFLCYKPPVNVPEVGPLSCRECSYITFGSFNNLTKTTPEVIKIWAGILHAIPDSRLLLKAKQLKDDQTRKRFEEMFAREDIARERLEMHSRLPEQGDHMGLYNRVDIALDPFPYNGTTTTCEALWMGVPVVTLLGGHHSGRVGASILHHIGLNELVASSVEEYIEFARSLALDQRRLKQMRASLRGRMQESKLMDSDKFTKHLEDVYQEMWRQYCESVQGLLDH